MTVKPKIPENTPYSVIEKLRGENFLRAWIRFDRVSDPDKYEFFYARYLEDTKK